MFQVIGTTPRSCSLTNLEFAAGIFLQLGFQVIEIQATSCVFRDGHDVHVVLPPRQDVGVMLERPYEDDRPIIHTTRQRREG